ncbi:MFS transporter [Amycolatopsis sp. DG1A-15b]|uniref:MFS transporter n=1 Tax=Amycolatopsis sp. DG1A-15b TaxID=3052846 RepID=UPI00255BFDD6|nr:MFS transporter [Amycolatopsis sp. DG1A-15b]WIX91743.1 MFS transporter [Amycolatopsis sp. DG1A-15b]
MAVTPRPGWVILASSLPMFMVALNNLVVTNALPEIGQSLDTDVAGLQWVVNGYVLAFAGLLLTGAALGDRYGRRLVFVGGIVLFSLGSIACALSDSTVTLVLARVVQGMGAAAVQPLSLTLLSAAVPPHRRSAAIGLWGGVNGLGIALGPLIGGAVTEGIAWQWIFWINLPVGMVAIPLVFWAVRETKGADRGLDLPGVLLVTGAVTTAVLAIVRAGDDGWASPRILGLVAAAVVLAVLFVVWEQRAASPLLPLGFYRIRAFVLTNLVSLAMFFGVFGGIFFLAQFMQGPMGFAPLEAGLRTLPWTAAPMIVAPLAGLITDRVGGGRLMALGLLLQGGALGWIALMARIDLPYAHLVPPLILAGIGMGLALAPATAVVLGAVSPQEHGKASGATNTIREVGGALGVAVLTTVFRGPLRTTTIWSPVDYAHAFVAGMTPATLVGVAVILAGSIIALFIPRSPPKPAAVLTEPAVGKERAPL